MIRVLVVEDHAQTRAGIRDYLIDQGMEVRVVSNTADALDCVADWEPEVVVLDIVIPPHAGEKVNLHQGEGVRVAEFIKTRYPEIGIVLLSNHPYYRPEFLDLAGQGYGGLAYLFKGEGSADELREAILQVKEGSVLLDPQISQAGDRRPGGNHASLTELERSKSEYALSQMGELTEREWEVLQQVAQSRTNAGIAKELFIAPITVQTHLSNIYSKLGLAEGEALALLDKRALLGKIYTIHRSKHGRRR